MRETLLAGVFTGAVLAIPFVAWLGTEPTPEPVRHAIGTSAWEISDTEAREDWDLFQLAVAACYRIHDTDTVSFPWSPHFAFASSVFVRNGMTAAEWIGEIGQSNSNHYIYAPCVLDWLAIHGGQRV